MDLQEWEILPDDGFLEIHYDSGKKIFSRKYVNDARAIFKNDYFPCPSPEFSQFVESTEQPRLPKQLLPLPLQLEPATDKAFDHEVVKEVTRVPIQIKTPDTGPLRADQDPVSQVFFKKMKETEKFADMKVDSPRSSHKGVMHQVDPGALQFEKKGNPTKDEDLESEKDAEMVIKKNNTDENNREISDNFNIWKWSLSGIGAVCSFGIAAAAICIIFFGSRQKNKLQPQQAQKLQFHIYTDDKRIKRVVRHATRLNEAISAATGVPITRAHFTIGGYCDGL